MEFDFDFATNFARKKMWNLTDRNLKKIMINPGTEKKTSEFQALRN